MCKLVIICGCFIAVANGGLIGTSGPGSITLQPSAIALQPATVGIPTISSSSSNIIRGIGNLGAISAYSKSIDTAFSSERKADVRINNPDVQTGILSTIPATLSYAATAPALAVSGTALAGHLDVAHGPAVTAGLTAPGLATTSLGLGLNGVTLNGYGLGVSGLGLGVNGYGLQNVNGLGPGFGAVRVL